MSELDRLKEQVAYLKFWQGIMVVELDGPRQKRRVAITILPGE